MRQPKWFETFQWKTNPFKIQPDPDHIIGFVDMRSKILSYIHSHDPFMIIGPTGSGKTTMLLWAKNHKDDKYVYHNLITDSDEDIRKKAKKGLFDKLRGKDVVLLLDEAQEMDPETAKWLRAAFDNGKIKSLVIAAVTKDIDSLQEPLVNRIGSRIIETRKFEEKEADQFIRQRIYSHGKHNPFDDEALKIIFSHSSYHPRKILENCEYLCMKAHDLDYDYIGPEFVNKYLGVSITKETIKERVLAGDRDTSTDLRQRLETNLKSSLSTSKSIERNPLLDEPMETKPAPKTTVPKTPKPVSKPQPSKNKGSSALSPSQVSILQAIGDKEMATAEIAEKIGGNRASVAKQLSRLALNTDVKTLKNKGITKPLVKANTKTRPVVYSITAEGKKFV